MLEDLALPPAVHLVRSTPEFTADTVPAALLSAHRVADGVWGVLRVHEGEVGYTVEATGEHRVVGPGQRQVIEPGVEHRVAPSDDARFAVEFHRP